jgi:hypothetical protein
MKNKKKNENRKSQEWQTLLLWFLKNLPNMLLNLL